MSKLLINEPPLQVLPSLAKAIGLNEAIVLQQLHYWISNPKVGKEHDGMRWVYNSVREWQEDNFPFWSEATIKRALASLRENGIVFAENLNRAEYDRTLWYTINYEALGHIDTTIWSNCTNGKTQVDQMEKVNLTKPIPETTTENTKDYSSSGAVAAYEQTFGPIPNKITSDTIADDVATYGETTVIEAINAAALAGARSYRWVSARLKGRQSDNGKAQHVTAIWDEVLKFMKRSATWQQLTPQAQGVIRKVGGQSRLRDVKEGFEMDQLKREVAGYV